MSGPRRCSVCHRRRRGRGPNDCAPCRKILRQLRRLHLFWRAGDQPSIGQALRDAKIPLYAARAEARLDLFRATARG